MKKTLEYKGFKIEFIVPEKLVALFEENNLDINKFLSNSWEWFEVLLFEQIDKGDGNPNLKYGKEFIIIFDSIITGLKNNKEQKIPLEVKYPNLKLIGEVKRHNIESKFMIEYKIYSKYFSE